MMSDLMMVQQSSDGNEMSPLPPPANVGCPCHDRSTRHDGEHSLRY